VQNTAVALIENTLAQVSQQVKQSVQYGANRPVFSALSAVASSNEATAQSLLQLRTDVAGNTNINSLSQSLQIISRPLPRRSTH
jgi:hypothetical protein